MVLTPPEETTSRSAATWCEAAPVTDANSNLPEWYRALRDESWDRFAALPAPTRTNQSWRFADLKHLRLGGIVPPPRFPRRLQPISSPAPCPNVPRPMRPISSSRTIASSMPRPRPCPRGRVRDDRGRPRLASGPAPPPLPEARRFPRRGQVRRPPRRLDPERNLRPFPERLRRRGSRHRPPLRRGDGAAVFPHTLVVAGNRLRFPCSISSSRSTETRRPSSSA